MSLHPENYNWTSCQTNGDVSYLGSLMTHLHLSHHIYAVSDNSLEFLGEVSLMKILFCRVPFELPVDYVVPPNYWKSPLVHSRNYSLGYPLAIEYSMGSTAGLNLIWHKKTVLWLCQSIYSRTLSMEY